MGKDKKLSVKEQLAKWLGDYHNRFFIKAEERYGNVSSEQLITDFNEAAEAEGLAITTSNLTDNPNVLTLSVCIDLDTTLKGLKESQESYDRIVDEHSRLSRDDRDLRGLKEKFEVAQFELETAKEAVGFFILQLVRVVAVTTLSDQAKHSGIEKSLKRIEGTIDRATRLLDPLFLHILETISKDLKIEGTN